MDVRVTDVKKWVGREERVRLVEPWPDECQARVEFPLVDQAEVAVTVRNTGAQLVVTVAGTARFAAVCSRCLEPFSLAEPFESVEEFREEPGPDDPLAAYYRYTGDKIGLDLMVADAVGVSVPLAPVCRPDCQGLCPVCGTNLNESACDCRPEPDARWEVLRGWGKGADTKDSREG